VTGLWISALHSLYLFPVATARRRRSGRVYYHSLTHSVTHGAVPFLRSCQLCNSRTCQHFMEPEGSLPCSQDPQLVPILSQINPIHAMPSYLSKIHFNIVHPPTSWSSQWSLSFFGFPTNILYAFLFSPFVLHALPISSLTWSFWLCLEKSTSYESVSILWKEKWSWGIYLMRFYGNVLSINLSSSDKV
jgi:hypothetical protein